MDTLTIDAAKARDAETPTVFSVSGALKDMFGAHVDYINALDGSAEESEAKWLRDALLDPMSQEQRNAAITALNGLARLIERAG